MSTRPEYFISLEDTTETGTSAEVSLTPLHIYEGTVSVPRMIFPKITFPLLSHAYDNTHQGMKGYAQMNQLQLLG